MGDDLDTGVQGGSRRSPAQCLRDVGRRATPQRLLILGVFAPGEHLTADEVHARVSALSPVANLSTVYRTLELLRDIGLLSETDLGGESRVFELLEGARHHHLICRSCGQMHLLDDDLVRHLGASIQKRYEFEARIDHLALFGVCQACRQQPALSPAPERE